MVKGIATQGHYGRFSTDMVSVYVISFANNSGGPFLYKQNGSKNKVSNIKVKCSMHVPFSRAVGYAPCRKQEQILFILYL